MNYRTRLGLVAPLGFIVYPMSKICYSHHVNVFKLNSHNYRRDLYNKINAYGIADEDSVSSIEDYYDSIIVQYIHDIAIFINGCPFFDDSNRIYEASSLSLSQFCEKLQNDPIFF